MRRRGFSESAATFEPPALAGGQDVHEVQASVAKAHFSQLLDAVEGGATIVILRHGRPIARLLPDPEHRLRKHSRALDNIRKLAKRREAEFGPISVEEIISSIHEGHKY